MRNQLSCQNLSVSFGKVPLFNQFSHQFTPAKFTAILGANGSGKSTLLRALLGLIKPVDGSVMLGDSYLSALSRRKIAQRIAYLPQENHYSDHMTVGELIEMSSFARRGLFGGIRQEDRQEFYKALTFVGLTELAGQRLCQLSGGQRQRAFVAMVLAQQTPIILMDEPVNHLDVKYQYAVLDLARDLVISEGKTVLMVLHDINLAAAYADEAIVLDRGQILAQGPMSQILDDNTFFQCFGIKAKRHQIDGRQVYLPYGENMVSSL